MSKASLLAGVAANITSNGINSITGAILRTQLENIINEVYPDGTEFKTLNGETLTGSGNIVITKTSLGLGSVDNTTDANKPVSTLQAAADTAVLTAAQTYADGLVVGLLDDRGNYDASVNTFPAAGGSGPAGAIKKGDLFTVSVAGTLGGKAVTAGDVVRAIIDTPGQTAANWAITENNFGYVALNAALNLSDLTNAGTARTNLGLGSLAVLSTATPTTGGTGIVTYTTGDLLYASATNVLSKLTAGANGQTLTLSGGVPVWATPAGGASLSGLTAATGANTIDNGANLQTWSFNALTSGTGLCLSSSSTLASGNLQTILEVTHTGTNATSSLRTFGARITSVKGANSNANCALYLSAAGVASAGTSNSRALEINSGDIYINASGTQNPIIRWSSGAYLYDNTFGQMVWATPAGTNTGFQFSPNSVSGIGVINHFSGAAGFGLSSFSSTRNAFMLGAYGYFAGYYAGGASAVVLERDADVFSISADSATGSGFYTPTKIVSVRGSTGNMGVGTQTPLTSSILDLTSTIKGFLPPRMTTAQKNAISSPATGLVVYDTTLNKLCVYTSAAWETVTSA